MKLIILDGINGSGKSTLRYALMKKYNYNILTIDRFTPSIWVYDKLRGINRPDILEYEEKVDKILPLVVICICKPETAEKRSRITDLRKVEFSYLDQIQSFKEYTKVSKYLNVLLLDTEQSIEKCLNIIGENLI
jgi:thymidylate kinase